MDGFQPIFYHAHRNQSQKCRYKAVYRPLQNQRDFDVPIAYPHQPHNFNLFFLILNYELNSVIDNRNRQHRDENHDNKRHRIDNLIKHFHFLGKFRGISQIFYPGKRFNHLENVVNMFGFIDLNVQCIRQRIGNICDVETALHIFPSLFLCNNRDFFHMVKPLYSRRQMLG